MNEQQDIYGQDEPMSPEFIEESAESRDADAAIAKEFLDEIEARLENIKLYFPIINIFKRRSEESPLLVLLPELCFLLLAYLIYEGRLMHRGLTFKQIEAFIVKFLAKNLTETGNNAEPDDARKLAVELLDELQFGGKNFSFNTFDFKTGAFKTKFVKLIDVKQADDGTLLYYISEQGVDFFLRTKEFPDETKITINLLLFQRQLEKGAFEFAHATLKRLNMEVQKKKDRKYSILEAVMLGRLDGGEAYDDYHKNVRLQFQEEADLFNTAVKNVNDAFWEYFEKIKTSKGDENEKDQRALLLLKTIEKEIGRAQTLHTELLKESAAFAGEYELALSAKRKAVFAEGFKFQMEMEQLVTKNAPPEALKLIFEPLLSPHVNKAFNPLRVLEPQRIIKGKAEENDEEENEQLSERMTLDMKIKKRVRETFVFYAVQLLKALDSPPKSISLEDFAQLLRDKYGDDIVYNGDFIAFVIEMNGVKKITEQSPRQVDFNNGAVRPLEDVLSIEDIFIKANIELGGNIGINQIFVESRPDEDIAILPGLKMTNIIFTGGTKW